MSRDKPIRVFCSTLTGDAEFYATQHYKQVTKNGKTFFEITGKKYNVTQDVLRAFVENDLEYPDFVPDGEEAEDAP